MNDYALVINAAPSCLKFCVYRRPARDWRMVSRGLVDGIGTSPRLLARDINGRVLADRALDAEVRENECVLDAVAGWLKSMYGGARVLGVGHRVVHGGPKYGEPTLITPQVVADLYRLVPLAPFHLRANLAAIEAVSKRLPDVPQVACFDTGFHRGQPPVAQIVPLPREICNGTLQRYGSHGISYEFIASRLPQIAPDLAGERVIVAHLDSGSSLCAMHNRRSIDCTLGFTALDGLCMDTRPGSLDPGVVLYLFRHLGLDASTVEAILYKKSGLLGISGISGDLRELLGRVEPRAQLAVDYFVYRAVKEIGAMAAVLGGVDALVFTGGIGEGSAEIRRRISEACGWLGVVLNTNANAHSVPMISSRLSRVSVWVIPTNEELMIARQTGVVLGLVEPRALTAGS